MAGAGRRQPRVDELQRQRILDAVVEVVAERGAANASVGMVIARAGVSTRTFYEYFDGLEACLIAVLDGGLERVGALAAEAFRAGQGGPWQDGMRAAMAAVLGFFDAEPRLARVLVVETPASGARVREHRERTTAAFRALIVKHTERDVSHASPLAAEGALGSVVSIVGARLIAPEPRPLLGLLGPLMGVIVAPFMDDAAVAREIAQGDRLAREIAAQRASCPSSAGCASPEHERALIPAALRNPRARRARECLLYLARRGGREPGPSNREIGQGVGVGRDAQISTLLARLAAIGLIEKRSSGPGRPNAWRLTALGERVARALEEM